MNYWQISIIIAIGILGALYLYKQKRTKNDVGNILREVMPLWASFAPFKDGHDSSSIMYYCGWATHGKKFADGLENRNAYKGHADSFNSKPDDWEKLVKESAEINVDDLEKKRRLVFALIELDHMKQEGELPDWNSYYALGHIVTSQENESAITFYGYLQELMETNSEIEKETIELIEDYVIYTDSEIDLTMSAGLLCYVCLNFAKENPELDSSKRIMNLNEETFEKLNVKED